MAAGYNGPFIRNYPFVTCHVFIYFLSYNHLFIQNIDIFIHRTLDQLSSEWVPSLPGRPRKHRQSGPQEKERLHLEDRVRMSHIYGLTTHQRPIEAPYIVLGPWSYAATGMERELLTIPTIDHIDH